MSLTARFFDFVDQRRVIRRVQIGILMWMLVDSYLWARGFAERTMMSGAELALVVGAVCWPITALMGIVYRQYDSSRSAEARK